MRCIVLLKVLLVSLFLSGCVAPLLMGAQSQLMWALLKPLVGFDPNEVNLFEQPLIKDRMQPLLGEHYGTAVQLLKTADEIQQEGPLFYVLSNNEVTGPMANKAGFVWNSKSNQMAVLLQEQGKSQVFSEPLAAAAQGSNLSADQLGAWPTAMRSMLDPNALQQQVAGAATQAVSGAVQGATSAATGTLNQQVSGAISQGNQVLVSPSAAISAQ